MLNHHPHLLRERCPAFPGVRGDGWKTLCSPSLKGRNYSLPVRPRAQHHFLYDSASPSVSEPETTLTPVGIFSFPIPKSALVQWGDLLLLLRAPWLRATARGGTAAQAIFQGPGTAILGWHMGTVSQRGHCARRFALTGVVQNQISAPCPGECLRGCHGCVKVQGGGFQIPLPSLRMAWKCWE